VRSFSNEDDRREIALWIERQLVVQRGVADHYLHGREEQRVAVGLARCGGCCGEIACGTGDVVRNDRLLPHHAEPLRDAARGKISSASRRKGDNHADRLCGIGFCMRQRQACYRR
jgi:hypothetical protein